MYVSTSVSQEWEHPTAPAALTRALQPLPSWHGHQGGGGWGGSLSWRQSCPSGAHICQLNLRHTILSGPTLATIIRWQWLTTPSPIQSCECTCQQPSPQCWKLNQGTARMGKMSSLKCSRLTPALVFQIACPSNPWQHSHFILSLASFSYALPTASGSVTQPPATPVWELRSVCHQRL